MIPSSRLDDLGEWDTFVLPDLLDPHSPVGLTDLFQYPEWRENKPTWGDDLRRGMVSTMIQTLSESIGDEDNIPSVNAQEFVVNAVPSQNSFGYIYHLVDGFQRFQALKDLVENKMWFPVSSLPQGNVPITQGWTSEQMVYAQLPAYLRSSIMELQFRVRVIHVEAHEEKALHDILN